MNTTTEERCNTEATGCNQIATANYLAVSILLVLLSIASCFLNILLVATILKTRKLRTLSCKLIMMLAASDLAIAITTLPLLAAREINHYRGAILFWVKYPLTVEGYSFTFLSLVTVGLIALDQCLAISYPYFYERSVRFRYMAIPVLILWTVFTIFAAVVVWKQGLWKQIGKTVTVVLYIILCIAILTCYLKIYFVARSVRLRIAETNKEEAEKIRQRAKVSKTSAIILFVVFMCYIPRFTVYALKGNDSDMFRSLAYLDSWWDMIALSDCLWDAVICLWRITPLRLAAIRLLSKCGRRGPRVDNSNSISPHTQMSNQEQRL